MAKPLKIALIRPLKIGYFSALSAPRHSSRRHAEDEYEADERDAEVPRGVYGRGPDRIVGGNVNSGPGRRFPSLKWPLSRVTTVPARRILDASAVSACAHHVAVPLEWPLRPSFAMRS